MPSLYDPVGKGDYLDGGDVLVQKHCAVSVEVENGNVSGARWLGGGAEVVLVLGSVRRSCKPIHMQVMHTYD